MNPGMSPPFWNSQPTQMPNGENLLSLLRKSERKDNCKGLSVPPKGQKVPQNHEHRTFLGLFRDKGWPRHNCSAQGAWNEAEINTDFIIHLGQKLAVRKNGKSRCVHCPRFLVLCSLMTTTGYGQRSWGSFSGGPSTLITLSLLTWPDICIYTFVNVFYS